MEKCQTLYEEARHCNEKIKLLLLEISRSNAANKSPALADRVSRIRGRFQQLSEDIDELWGEYQRATINR